MNCLTELGQESNMGEGQGINTIVGNLKENPELIVVGVCVSFTRAVFTVFFFSFKHKMKCTNLKYIIQQLLTNGYTCATQDTIKITNTTSLRKFPHVLHQSALPHPTEANPALIFPIIHLFSLLSSTTYFEIHQKLKDRRMSRWIAIQ